MAFPVPQHLPRAGQSAEGDDIVSLPHLSVAQRILGDIAVSLSNLTSARARNCVEELDRTINDTKTQLYSHIQRDPLAFNRQAQSGIDISQRTAQLVNDVRHLESVLNNPDNGLMPALLKNLSAHQLAAQLNQDAMSRTNALDTFLTCFSQLEEILVKTRQGHLPEASQLCRGLSGMLSASEADGQFQGSNSWTNLIARFRATDDNIQEQLGKAYHRAVIFTSSGPTTSFQVHKTVKLSVWTKSLELSSIVSAMRDVTVAAITSSLRRDITNRILDPVLKGNARLEAAGDVLTIHAGHRDQESILSDLEGILLFLKSSLPAPIMASLHLDLSPSVLKYLLVPSLPHSLPELPPFLRLLRDAVSLEVQSGEGQGIKEWADDIGLHYEKARRQAVLDQARAIILDGVTDYFEVEDIKEREQSFPGLPNQPDVSFQTAPSNRIEENTDVSRWDFEEAKAASASERRADSIPAATEEVNDETWGFDSEEPPEPSQEGHSTQTGASGWGWDDTPAEIGPTEDEDPWDDPKPVPKSNGASMPRAANRLEKRAARGRQPAVSKDAGGSSQQPNPAISGPSASRPTRPQPPPSAPTPGKLTFTVSQRAQAILHVADMCLEESKQLLVHQELPRRHPPTGTLMMTTLSALFDLFRALPQEDVSSPRYMIFSNDCIYLSRAVQTLAQSLPAENEVTRLSDAAIKLETASARALISSVNEQIKVANRSLAPAAGFVNTADEAHAVQCHRAVETTLSECQNLARKWQPLLTFSKYARAIGAVVDSVLHSMMDAILYLPDITEIESHRLNALCTLMRQVEELFIRAPGRNSEIALYVHSWFKFNYLSTLLEASMADISEFFREGMLEDFHVQEIASLLRALFADTPLRAQTIDMVLAGHLTAGHP